MNLKEMMYKYNADKYDKDKGSVAELKEMLYAKGQNYDLLKGDVLKVLKSMPSGIVDMIVTSPPYNLGMIERNDTNIAKYDSYHDNMEYWEYCKWQKEILNELFRVAKKDSVLMYNHKQRFKNEVCYDPKLDFLSKTPWKQKQTITWHRGSAMNYNAGMFGDNIEYVYYYFKGDSPKTKTWHNVCGCVWNLDIERNNDHPAPFPLELPLRAIYSIFDNEENKIILDPFNGSGTTGVASLLLNHKYIGIDISEDYLNMSVKRLDNYLHESEKAQIELNRHSVDNPSAKRVSLQMTFFNDYDYKKENENDDKDNDNDNDDFGLDR